MKLGRSLRLLVAGAAVLSALLFDQAVGFPRHVHGHWVYKHISWYGLGTGLPICYPGIVYYYYRGATGEEIRHGSYREYFNPISPGRSLKKTGFYVDGRQEGTFTEWATNDGKRFTETFYRGGQKTGWAWYQEGQLIQYTEDLYEGDRRVATKEFSQREWRLTKRVPCLGLAIDPRSGEVRALAVFQCQ